MTSERAEGRNSTDKIPWPNPSQIAAFENFSPASDWSVSADGAFVALVPINGNIEVRNIADGSIVRSVEKGQLWSSAFNTDGDFLVARLGGSGAKITNESKGTSKDFQIPGVATTSIPLSQDGRFLACSCRGGNAYIFDVEKGDRVEFRQDNFQYGEIYFSPSGNLLATKDQDNAVRILSRTSKGELLRIKNEKSRTKTVSFSSDDTLFAISDEGGNVTVLKTADGTKVSEINLRTHPLSLTAFSTAKI